MYKIIFIYLLSIIFRLKNGAKVQQIFELCKFFGKKFINNLQKLSKTKSQITHLQYFTIFEMLKSFPK